MPCMYIHVLIVYAVKAGDKATPKHTIFTAVGRLFDLGEHIRTLAQANHMHKNTVATGSGGKPLRGTC